jgi:hypothetical protein
LPACALAADMGVTGLLWWCTCSVWQQACNPRPHLGAYGTSPSHHSSHMKPGVCPADKTVLPSMQAGAHGYFGCVLCIFRGQERLWHEGTKRVVHFVCVCCVLADPLRVMRAVRFATRFGFAPDPAIMESASSKEVSHVDRSNFLIASCMYMVLGR